EDQTFFRPGLCRAWCPPLCRWQSCALFSFRRTEAEAPTKAMSLRGVIRSFRTDRNSSTLRRRGEGETANRVEMRPGIGLGPTPDFQGTSGFWRASDTTRDRWDSMARARFARRCVEHRLPQSRDNGRCSPALYDRVEAGQHEGCQSCDRFEYPSSAASNGYHRRSISNRSYQPSDA